MLPFHRSFTLLKILAAVGFLAPAPLGAQPSAPDLTLAEVSAHIRFLAADELAGRLTGTSGNRIAARYIAEHFRGYGLQPPPGAEDYFQEVPLVKVQPSPKNRLVVLEDTLRQSRGLLLLEPGELRGAFPAVFLEKGATEVAEADTLFEGRIVFTDFGAPGSVDLRAHLQASQRKRERFRKLGAAALVELYQGPLPWRQMAQFFGRARYSLADSEPHAPTPGFAHLLVERTQLHELPTPATNITVHAEIHPQQESHITSRNVLGLVEGRDPELRDQYVLLTAHYDHIGTFSPPDDAEAPVDTIFNGARDNGMGTTALLSAAKVLAKAPPARSLLFVAFTAEELGLLGSKYYAKHPVVSLDRTAFVLNTDGGGYTDTTVVTVLGLVRTTAGPAIEAACEAVGLQAIPDPVPHMGLFGASDNATFVEKEVPAITFSPGFRDFGAEMRRYYHQAGDEADENFAFSYLLRFSRAYTRVAQAIANLPNQPEWDPAYAPAAR